MSVPLFSLSTLGRPHERNVHFLAPVARSLWLDPDPTWAVLGQDADCKVSSAVEACTQAPAVSLVQVVVVMTTTPQRIFESLSGAIDGIFQQSVTRQRG